VLLQLAGTFEDFFAVAESQSQFAGNGKQSLFVNHAWTQQSWRNRCEIENSRFDTDLGLATVDDERNFVPERFLHVRRVCR